MGSTCRLALGDVDGALHVVMILICTPQTVRPGTKSPVSVDATPTMTNVTCPICGNMKKSGKRNCCARGGAWFKKCGDIGEKKFDHTWIQGIQACISRS